MKSARCPVMSESYKFEMITELTGLLSNTFELAITLLKRETG